MSQIIAGQTSITLGGGTDEIFPFWTSSLDNQNFPTLTARRFRVPRAWTLDKLRVYWRGAAALGAGESCEIQVCSSATLTGALTVLQTVTILPADVATDPGDKATASAAANVLEGEYLVMRSIVTTAGTIDIVGWDFEVVNA